MNLGNRVLCSTLCCAALGVVHQPGWAQDEAGETAEPPRRMDVSVPPPGPRVHRTAYVHEGFYLRVNVGPSWQWTALNDRTDLNLDLSGNSFAFAADLLIGGSPSPGLALGVGILTNTALNMNLRRDGADVAQTNAGHFIIGPFFDAFPDNRAGWHLGAEVGFAMTQFERQPEFINAAYGGGAAAWVGHDWWVAPEWSAGIALRLSGAYLIGTQDEFDTRSTTVTASLLVSLLYN